MASTGVIGEPLDATRITRVIDTLVADAREDTLLAAAKAIMTTDTYPKIATARVKLGEQRSRDQRHRQGRRHDRARHGDDAGLRVHGRSHRIASTAGDAVEIGRALVQRDHSRQRHLDLRHADGCSPLAQPRTRRTIEEAADPRAAEFRRALDKLLRNLAHQVVRDGEGARKFITVNVEGAATRKAAKRIALSIANSPLVKTACAGEDANWGRVVMAVGKAGEKAERDKLDIFFGKIRVAHQGLRDPVYDEAETSAYMKRDSIEITADLGIGRGRATVWTCDLTKEYVAINGDYRS